MSREEADRRHAAYDPVLRERLIACVPPTGYYIAGAACTQCNAAAWEPCTKKSRGLGQGAWFEQHNRRNSKGGQWYNDDWKAAPWWEERELDVLYTSLDFSGLTAEKLAPWGLPPLPSGLTRIVNPRTGAK